MRTSLSSLNLCCLLLFCLVVWSQAHSQYRSLFINFDANDDGEVILYNGNEEFYFGENENFEYENCKYENGENNENEHGLEEEMVIQDDPDQPEPCIPELEAVLQLDGEWAFEISKECPQDAPKPVVEDGGHQPRNHGIHGRQD